MNRTTGLFGATTAAPPLLVAIATTTVFSLILLGVMFVGLPIWSVLIVIAAIVYAFTVLHRPIVGVYVVVAVFFVPIRFSLGFSLLQSVGGGTAAILLLWFLYHQRKIKFATFMIPLLLLGPLILVSLLYTRDAAATLMFFRRWVFNMMFVLLLLNLVTNFETFKKVLWAIMLMASANSIVGMVDSSGAAEVDHRSMGLTENANNLGHLAALAFPLALYQYLYAKGWQRWLGLSLCAVLAGGIVASVSRGALVSLTVVFAIVMVVERRRVLPLLLILGLGFSSIPLLPNYFIDRTSNLVEDVKNTVVIQDQRQLSSRGHLNAAGLRIWLAHPVMGVGIGNFGYYYMQREFMGADRPDKRIGAHNIYIQALSELGILGGLVLLWLLLHSGLSVVRARRSTDRNSERWPYMAAIEMMALAILVNTASAGHLMGNDLWMFLGLTVIAGEVAKNKDNP